MKYQCPKHRVNLREVKDYPGTLIHDGCPDIFTVIDGCLCVLDGNVWRDTETNEIRIPKREAQ